MFDGRGADERVVHRSSGDAELAKPGQQIGGGVITKETRRGKVVCNQTGDRDWTPSRRRWQPGEDGKRLKGGMAGQPERPVASGIDHGAMVLVIS